MIVLDTHVLIWFALDSPRLGAKAAEMADAALRRDELVISAVSFWELAMLVAKNRVRIDDPPETIRGKTLAQGVREVPLSGVLGISAARLAYFHGDPADRFITATAMSLDATLLTADDRLLAWRGGLKTYDARR